MDEDIIRANKSYRKRTLIILVALVLLGAAGIEWGIPWIREYLRRSDPETAAGIIKAWFIFTFLSTIPMGLYILALGRKVIKYERIPPPGAKVIIDTRPIRGHGARVRGRVLVAVSLCLMALGLSGALYTAYMVDKLATAKGRPGKSPYSDRGTVLPRSP